MLALVESPRKPVVEGTSPYLAIDTTPRAQVTSSVLDLPPMKLGHKIGFRYPGTEEDDILLESPSKPSRNRSSPRIISNIVIGQSPELVSDEDTLSDSSIGTSGLISPTSELSPFSPIVPESIADKNDSKANLCDSPPIKDYYGKITHEEDALSENMIDIPLRISGDDILPFFQSPQKRGHAADSRVHSLKRSCREIEVDSIPPKSILKLPKGPDALNFVVTSTNGSIIDATIFATEINSCVENIPLPKSIWEKVTIPVNVQVKENFKRGKGKMIGGYYDFEEDPISDKGLDNCESNEPEEDAAIIRGYDFHEQVPSSSGRDGGFISKKRRDIFKKKVQKRTKILRWADFV